MHRILHYATLQLRLQPNHESHQTDQCGHSNVNPNISFLPRFASSAVAKLVLGGRLELETSMETDHHVSVLRALEKRGKRTVTSLSVGREST